MKYGFLSGHFDGIAAKRLTAVEVKGRSNQHELNGSAPLRDLLGASEFPSRSANFIWLGDEHEGITERSFITWYDARERHPTRKEWRLYYPNNTVMERANEGDLLIIAQPSEKNRDLTVIVAQGQSTSENQLIWLFGLASSQDQKFVIEKFVKEKDRKLNFASLYILDQLEITVEEPESERLDRLIQPFDGKMPTTRDFSQHARKTLSETEKVSAQDDPDAALMLWMKWELKLFHCFERHDINRIVSGIQTKHLDNDQFIEHAKSLLNRRKSRAGYALENHVEEILRANKIRYGRGVKTGYGEPDFLFPGIKEYKDPKFPPRNLFMLGVKTSCKDRWRQVLSEVRPKIPKYLLTLEAAITESQTDAMRQQNLQLVLPLELHETYQEKQRDWLMSIREFVEFMRRRQEKMN